MQNTVRPFPSHQRNKHAHNIIFLAGQSLYFSNWQGVGPWDQLAHVCINRAIRGYKLRWIDAAVCNYFHHSLQLYTSWWNIQPRNLRLSQSMKMLTLLFLVAVAVSYSESIPLSSSSITYIKTGDCKVYYIPPCFVTHDCVLLYQ